MAELPQAIEVGKLIVAGTEGRASATDTTKAEESSNGIRKISKSVDVLESKALGACSVANSPAVFACRQLQGDRLMNLLLDTGSDYGKFSS